MNKVENIKILIVEDEKPLSKALSLKLSSEGFDVTVLENGVDAAQNFKDNNYQVVMLDLIMPEKDGFKVIEEISAIDKDAQIIVLSNLGQDKDMERAESLGAKKYFVKSDTSLAEIVEYVVKINQK